MGRAIRVEAMKLRRSTVSLTTGLLIAVFMPLMGLGLYEVALNGGSGPLAAKAAAFMIGEGWDGYLGVVGQIASVAMFLGVGVMAAWVFGREHSDGTFSALFALPVAKWEIALAKFAVLSGWLATVVLAMSGFSVLLGVIVGVGEAGGDPIAAAGLLLAVGSLSSMLGLGAGLAASVGRGYLPAIGAIIVVIAVSQVAVLFGTGAWFPFAVPGLLAVGGAESAPEVSPFQVALVPLTAIVLMAWTVWWWDRSEAV